jgi:cytochrome o ubiquinol oxidase operon protein cyoD
MTIARYLIGFVLSLILTLAAYVFVTGGYHSPWTLAALGVLAIVQMVVQLMLFLHLGEEAGPRFKLWSFLFMGGSLIIIVIGSIWIIHNMNYNMANMTPNEKDSYMLTQHDKGF